MPTHFVKFHGLGNDYLVIESEALAGTSDLGSFARRICNRHYGAGADGIAVVKKSESAAADFDVRIFNPDGSEAALSGNGTRCAAGYLHYKKLWTEKELRLSTLSGVKKYFLREIVSPGKYVFDSELGQPKFDTRSIPMSTEEPLDKVIHYPLMVGGENIPVTALQMGNPNCCIFVKDFETMDWRRIGRAIESHRQFPDRTNVVFVRVIDRGTLELRIWERGVGETTASGTCSCAGAVAAMVNDKADHAVTVMMPGGQVRINWRSDGEVEITGSSEVVYSAELLP